MRIVLKLIMKYQTKHRLDIINCLKNNEDKHLTVEEISSLLNGSVPLATLYRIIDSLLQEGMIRKYCIDNNTPACYQLADNSVHQHFHLICSKCGKIIHLNCDEVNHLLNHIEDEHSFCVDITKVNLYGLCSECKEKKL